MINFKDNKRAVYNHIMISVIFIIGSATLISLGFKGLELFSSFPYYLKYTSFGLTIGFVFWTGHWTISYCIEKFDWMKNPQRANRISLLLYIIFGIIVSPLIPYIFDRFVWGMTGEDLVIDVLVKSLMLITLDMIVISVYYSTYLTKYWVKSIEKNEELKRENLLAKYEALKNQVNPHFLFNSLNTLSGVVEQKPELATDYIKKLSDIYRYVLEKSDQEIVSIHDEMKFVEDYIFLLKMRFGEALMFHSNVPAHNTIQIAPLGLQMLVENAIKHNVIADDMPLRIEIGIENNSIIVRNNYQKKNTISLGKKPMGLENLKKRYAYLSGSTMKIEKSDNEFLVKLPIIES